MSGRIVLALASIAIVIALCFTGFEPAMQPQLPRLAARLTVEDDVAALPTISAATRVDAPVELMTSPPPTEAEVKKSALSASTDLATQIRDWRARAAGGDVAAQCRYAAIAQHCTPVHKIYAPWARARLETPEFLTATTEQRPDCRGVSEHDTSGAFDALLQASERGFTPAQLLFAAGGAFTGLAHVETRDRLQRYRERAEALAWRAFATGDADAAVLLWRAYNDVDRDYLFLAAVIQRDPVKAHALDQLMLDLVPDHIAGSAREAGLSDEQAMQAQALLAEWRGRAFAHPRPPRFGSRIENMFDWEKRAVDLCAPAPQ